MAAVGLMVVAATVAVVHGSVNVYSVFQFLVTKTPSLLHSSYSQVVMLHTVRCFCKKKYSFII
jgi:hypothetical protein